MEYKDLPNLILSLILIGIMLGVGVLVIGNFGNAVRTTGAVSDDNITVINSTAVSLTNTELQSFTSLYNRSNLVDPTDYTVDLLLGTVTLIDNTTGLNNSQVNASYVRYIDTTATTQMDNVITALAPIASTWLPLIVTVSVLAIILVLVMRSFLVKR